MGSTTPNYSLYLPDYPESADIEQINENMTKLDTSLKAVSNKANTNSTDIAALKINDSGLVVQAADQTRASTTLINVTDLFFSVAAADITKKYIFMAHLFMDGQLFGPDVEFAFSCPGAGKVNFSGQGPHNLDLTSDSPTEAQGEWVARTNQSSVTATNPYGVGSSLVGITLRGLYLPAAAGAFRLQFAQHNPNATGIILKAGSYMEWKKYG